jgi:hypothetical protein
MDYVIRKHFHLLIVFFILTACSTQEFAGDAGVRRSISQKNPPLAPPTENPPIEEQSDDGVLTDDGTNVAEIPGVQVNRVGIGFEDWTDWDFNDIYVCFTGKFKVDGRSIVSTEEQTIQATWGNISAKTHFMTIKIVDSQGQETYSQGFQGTRRKSPIGTIPLTFKKGSKLHVMIAENSVQHTNPDRAVVHLDQCNNTGS